MTSDPLSSGAMETTTRLPWARRWSVAERRAVRWPPAVRGLSWAVAAGLLFTVLNAIVRELSLQLAPFQTQFLRYLAGLAVMTPPLLRAGLAAYRPRNVRAQFLRGGVHTAGPCPRFIALPRIGLADPTAIRFTTLISSRLAPCWCSMSPCGGGAGWPR